MPEQYMIRMSDCIPVRGKNRSIICDLTRNKFEIIPNDMYDFLMQRNKLERNAIYSYYAEKEQAVIKEYLTFLEEKEYIFWASKNDKDNFPEIERSFEKPYKLTNAEIDLSAKTENIKIFVNEILQLGVKYIHLRTLKTIELEKLEKIISLFEESRVESIELYIPYLSDISQAKLEILSQNCIRLSKINIYDSPKKIETCCLNYSTKNINSHSSFITCKDNMFIVNIDFFMESQFHNAFYYKKIALDSNGAIKNYLASEMSFGSINSVNIVELIKTETFQKLWNVTKDKIKNCKNCEFRYICFDTCSLTQKNGEYIRQTICKYES